MATYRKDSPDWFVPLVMRWINAQHKAAGMRVPFPGLAEKDVAHAPRRASWPRAAAGKAAKPAKSRQAG